MSITDQYLVSHAPLTAEALERGVEMKNIDAPFSLPPQEIPEEWSRPRFLNALNRARENGSIQERFLEKIDVYLYMSEREVAVVGFPKLDGKFDYLGFSSREVQMHKWCRDLFEYYWDRSQPRDEVLDETQRWLIKTPGAGEALRVYGEGRGEEVDGEMRSRLEENGLVREDKLTFLGLVMYRKLYPS